MALYGVDSSATPPTEAGLTALGSLATQSGTVSGTNTGDNATNTQYSGLAASKQDTLVSATNIKTINGSTVLGSGNLVVTGSDPWTYLVRSTDFTTTSATAVDVTGLAFTPAANTKYEFEAFLMVRTATATVGPRPGLAWATGLTDGVATIKQTSSLTAELTTNGNINAALLCAVGGVPTTTLSYPATVRGIVVAGATPSGTIKLQLASETAGTTVTIKTGSFLKYRSYA